MTPEPTKPTDVIKVILSTIVLVSGAVGSLISLINGANLPIVMAIPILAVAVVIILADLRSKQITAAENIRKEEKAQQAALAEEIKNLPVISAEQTPCVAPVIRGDGALYKSDGGRMVIRALRIR